MGTAQPRPPDKVRQFDKVCEVLDRHERRADRLIPILRDIQEEYRYLPEEVLAYVATSLRLPPAHVYGVATFYAHFALAPKGKHVVRLCDGTACHVRGSTPILDTIRKHLGLSETKCTTDDLLFTVETVSCLGACGLAPVIVVNDQVHGQVTPERAVAIIDAVAAAEVAP